MSASTETTEPATADDTRWASLYAEHLAILGARLERALAATGFDGLVIAAGEERRRFRDDTTYPFRAEPYFKQWLPLTAHPGCGLKLVPGQRPALAYLQSIDYWHAPAEDPAGFWVEHFDVHCVETAAETSAFLAAGPGRYAAIGEGMAAEGFAAVNDRALLARLDFERAFKTRYEVACMKEASTLGVKGHLAARQRLNAGVSEFELHQAFLNASGQRESELPYLSIVGLNQHAAVLHYQRLERTAPERVLSFLIDAGGEYAGYASDITRTWAGSDSPTFAALIASLETLQRTICQRVRAGVDFVELNAETHELLGYVLHEHGLIRCSAGEACARGITRTFLPHGLGHLLGLQVHDVGGRQIEPDGAERAPPAEHPHLRLTRRLEPGFVLTIEPGLYFIPSLLATLAADPAGRAVNWSAVEALLPCGGIRIEDNLLVGAEGATNLTRDAWVQAAGRAAAQVSD
jgi:Xaa-Pro dipeptidase